MAKGGAWQRMAYMVRGHVWQRGACMAKGGMGGKVGHSCMVKGGIHGMHAPLQDMASQCTGGTHPTGMHSC